MRDHALEKLRSALATGFYKPGARLVERELCEALGVSRTSVREALRQLQSENLIEVGPRRTIVVAVLSADDAEDIYLLREQVETLAIRRFVERDDPVASRALGTTFRALQRAASKGNLPALAESAGSLYEIILDGSGSRVLRDTGRQLLKRVSFLRLTSMSEPGRLQDGIAEWTAVLEAVAAHDADAAATALAEHIARARKTLVAKLRADATELAAV